MRFIFFLPSLCLTGYEFETSIAKAAFPKRFLERFLTSSFFHVFGVLNRSNRLAKPKTVGSGWGMGKRSEVAQLLRQSHGLLEQRARRLGRAAVPGPDGMFKAGCQCFGQTVQSGIEQRACIIHRRR
jgi:hypothetical protein